MTDRTIIEIPLDELHDSPFNPPNRATLAIDELAASIGDCGRLLLDCALVGNVTGGFWVMRSKPEALLAAAGYYGIDTDAVRQSVAEPVQTPAPTEKPAKGKKAAATQAELI